MRSRGSGKRGRVLRGVLVALMLLGHLGATFGFPLPPARPAKDRSRLYPCQDRPCGCASAEECWAGDCCCYSLQEKWAWAEANGVEPPGDARRPERGREARACAARACEAGGECCHGSGTETPASPCCGPRGRAVLGVLARQCRGVGAGAAFLLEPTVVTRPAGPVLDAAAPVGMVACPEVRVRPVSHPPDPPPPRRS